MFAWLALSCELICGAQLTELPATAQPGQRQERIGAGRHDQVQLIRKVVDQEGHRLVDLESSDRVVVVEHHDPLLAWLVFTGSSDVVDKRGQRGGRRGAGQRLETAASTSSPAR
jgi:hypothetical protein